MSGKSNGLVYLSVAVALLSLILSIVCVVFVFTKDDSFKDELTARLADLEEEHDILLEQDSVPVTADRRVDRPALCSLLPDPGPCSSQVNRWYYLEREDDCLEFPWGGCQGNDNNFLSVEQCRSACHVPVNKPRAPHLSARVHPPPTHSLPPPPPREDVFDVANCLLPPDSGPCTDRLSRFYHEGGQCKRFEYGGCAGNMNNFFTAGQCERRCIDQVGGGVRGTREPERSISREVCTLPQDSGYCDKSIERFRWDSRLRECVRFDWSGCGGNSNNFISKEKCENRCRI